MISPNGRGDLAEGDDTVSDSGWVTTQVAAAALKVAPRTVRDYIKSGKLTGRTEGQGVQKTWYVSIDSLHALRASRRGEDPGDARGAGNLLGQAHNRREAEKLTEEIAAELRGGPAADPAADRGEGQRHTAAETLGRDRDDILRDAILRLETRAAENAELRTRLELTEQAESTTREALERETEALQRERERADRLESEISGLREEARRPWYKRLFGS